MSSLLSVFDKVVKVLADVGMTLPSFQAYAQLFQQNDGIRRALFLFYADILDFYVVLLNFLNNRGKFLFILVSLKMLTTISHLSSVLNIVIESLWPNIRTKITKIQENIDQHKLMMTMNVTFEDILQAHTARKRALEEYEHAQEFRDRQNFSNIRHELNPLSYDAKLAEILRRSSVKSGAWLDNEPSFSKWLDPTDRTARTLWMHGIPGSGMSNISP